MPNRFFFVVFLPISIGTVLVAPLVTLVPVYKTFCPDLFELEPLATAVHNLGWDEWLSDDSAADGGSDSGPSPLPSARPSRGGGGGTKADGDQAPEPTQRRRYSLPLLPLAAKRIARTWTKGNSVVSIKINEARYKQFFQQVMGADKLFGMMDGPGAPAAGATGVVARARSLTQTSTGHLLTAVRVQGFSVVSLDDADKVAGEDDGLYARAEVSLVGQGKAAPLFRAGQIMKHKKYGYTAVIFQAGDVRCEAAPGWMLAMKVDALPQGRAQPFYHVLVDGSDRDVKGARKYVAEENIEILAPKESPKIEHPHLKKYFIGFVADIGEYEPKGGAKERAPDKAEAEKKKDEL